MESIARRWVPLLLVAGVSLLPSLRQSRAASSALFTGRSTTSTITSHAVRLTLALARDVYPQDALVKVLVTLKNVSSHTVCLEGGGPLLPGSSFPQVEVLSTAGKILFPPALPGWFSLAGPIPSYVPIAPGKGIKEKPYVLLRGPSLRVTVPILKNNRSLVPVSTVTAPPVHIDLTTSDAPQVHILGSSEKVSARIKQMESVTAKLLYEDAALCGGSKYEQHIGWTRMYSELTAGCSPLQIWHLVVGRLDHSVATVNYVPPRGPACMESFWGGRQIFLPRAFCLAARLEKVVFSPAGSPGCSGPDNGAVSQSGDRVPREMGPSHPSRQWNRVHLRAIGR